MRLRISIRGSVRPSVGPSVGPSVVRPSRVFFIAEIDKFDKSETKQTFISDKSDISLQFFPLLQAHLCSNELVSLKYEFLLNIGVGGQIDFIRGAAQAEDGLGKPIIALHSATNKGETKIVPTLKNGAGGNFR